MKSTSADAASTHAVSPELSSGMIPSSVRRVDGEENTHAVLRTDYVEGRIVDFFEFIRPRVGPQHEAPFNATRAGRDASPLTPRCRLPRGPSEPADQHRPARR